VSRVLVFTFEFQVWRTPIAQSTMPRTRLVGLQG
jgi:hypothetical protein